MQVRKQQLEPEMEQQTGSKLGKEYIKAVYCHLAYLIYMQSTQSWESLSHYFLKYYFFLILSSLPSGDFLTQFLVIPEWIPGNLSASLYLVHILVSNYFAGFLTSKPWDF